MTVTTLVKGYLEAPYLEDPYLTGLAEASAGMQTRIVIVDSLKPVGQQAAVTIVDSLKATGVQAHFQNVNALKPYGMQTSVTVNSQEEYGAQTRVTIVDSIKANGMQAVVIITPAVSYGQQISVTINSQEEYGTQALVNIVDFIKSTGMQAHVQIVNYLKSVGFEIRVDQYPSGMCDGTGYLEEDYLLSPYFTEIWCLKPGMQVLINIVDYQDPNGMQTEFKIVNKLRALGQQARVTIVDYLKPTGMQADVARVTPVGMQVRATIYNTHNLRILCEFPSRGLNATNWTANSTAFGDFSAQNLDTDIVEQVWRSATGALTGVRLTTDTGLVQGVFLDTMAMLNHNLTKSANITLLGTNDPTFSTIGITIPIQSRLKNIFYISPMLPTSGYRYWRFDIDDATNAAGYLEVGTIVFGASQIFHGECFVDQIEFELKDFADTVRTEGFTNVANSRTQKRRLRLDFRSLSFQLNNFTIMRSMFESERTVTKCLWIPTPHPTLQEITARFAVFGKLAVIPTETHNNKGPDEDWVTFTVDVDESL